MKIEEAIRILKHLQEPEAWESQINEAAFEALDMAVKTLGKRIPQRPIEKMDSDHIVVMQCPTCKEYIAAGNILNGALYEFAFSGK